MADGNNDIVQVFKEIETIILTETVTDTVIIGDDNITVIVIDDIINDTVVIENETQEVLVLHDGIRGEKGDSSDIFDMFTDNVLSGHRVISQFDNELIYADNNSENCKYIIGISNTSSGRGKIKICKGGYLKDTSFNFIKNEPIYLSNNGFISQSVPNSGYLVKLGFATETDTIFIKIGIVIKIS